MDISSHSPCARGDRTERESTIKDILYLLEKMPLKLLMRVRWYVSQL